jgi:DNA-binding PucR family transcriptional regulator
VLEATSCLTGAKQRPADDRLVGPADAASHELLLAVVDGSVTRAYAEQVLGPLVDWDLSHGSTLVETLREFLAVGGRWTEAAQALHIHPNTLRYRLDRVEQLTSRSLADSGDRVDVYLALKLLGDA